MKKSLFTLVLLLTATSQVSWGMVREQQVTIINKTGKDLYYRIWDVTQKEKDRLETTQDIDERTRKITRTPVIQYPLDTVRLRKGSDISIDINSYKKPVKAIEFFDFNGSFKPLWIQGKKLRQLINNRTSIFKIKNGKLSFREKPQSPKKLFKKRKN